ncbi:L-fucose isomerase [Parabacteroides sp. Marseille-P3160]|uniref:L-fucose isomerase n=1 Tax=Parabacteroides sp. Marseille-P3160 TaxID=1917887 RepID=UPI0009BBBC53|nr:L-fucose isomerase [Parabacteroides sp. Marseille-P3160]
MKKVNYPKIGIRPIIDGRRKGIRESLEETTMNMARSVAELYIQVLRYPDGSPVECVISDTCIGGVKEAADCAEKFERENVGLSISVTPCWCYGSETIDMNPLIPKAIWGFNGTQRPGAVYLAAALAAHNQKGLPTFGIYGREIQDIGDSVIPEDVKEKLLRFAKAGLVVAMLRGKSYLAIGTVSMGIGGSMVNPDFLQEYFGMRTEYVDCSEILRRVQQEIYDKDEYRKALAWTKKHCVVNELPDHNPEAIKRSRRQKDDDWEFVVKMTLIMRDLMTGNKKLGEMGFGEEALGHNAIAGGFQGQRQWTDFLPNGDFSEAILNSSFDWNGLREPFAFATENDHLNAMSMLFGKLLTNTAQLFADVRTYWSAESIEKATGWKPEGRMKEGAIHLINSGSCTLDGTGQQSKDGKPALKPFWEISEEEVDEMLKATQWGPSSLEYFRGGGYSSKFLTKAGMPVTMCRLNLVKGLGPVLQLAEGWTVTFPDHVFDEIDKRTDKTWPSTFFVPRTTGTGRFKDVYSVMNYWGANHGAISYGHIGADLISLASMFSIPVCMHNVDEDKIFRPSAWSAFGSDTEGSDFRACQTYGPLYK